MKKEKILKYLILTFTMIISFFMFSNASVKAAETKGVKIVDNLFFEVEEVEAGKYSIVGIYNTCNENPVCLESIGTIQNLVIPDFYNDGVNDYPIVSIADGNVISGVMEDLSSIVVGKISGGNNLTTIGTCAFCNFTKIDKVEVSSSVTLIKNYAFSGSGIKVLVINRYDGSSQDEKVSALESSDVFKSVGLLEHIVFKNSSVLRYYRDTVEVWSTLNMSSKFTFVITYRFCSSDVNCDSNYEDRPYYSGYRLSELPEDLSRVGFDFGGWVSMEFENEFITEDSVAAVMNSNDRLIHEVKPKWELSSPELTMVAYYNGNVDDDYKVIYGGKNKKLDLVVDVSHPLVNEDGFEIVYSWESDIKQIISTIEGNISNSHSISFVNQSGAYTCYVVIKYDGYEKTLQIKKNAEIVAKDLLINVNGNNTKYGTYVSAGKINNEYFTIDASTSLITGEKIKDYKVELYTNNNSDLVVGEYIDVLTAELLEIGYVDDSNNYIGNYSIVYNNGDLTIEEKVIDVSLVSDINIVYGEAEVLKRTVTDVVYSYSGNEQGFTNSIIITYTRSDHEVKDSGVYSIANAIVNNPNYSVYLENNAYKVIINPKQVEVDWVVDENLVYTGTNKNVSASYKDINNQVIDLKVSIKKDGLNTELVNAGAYVAVSEMVIKNDNYELINSEKNITITKAESLFIGDVLQNTVYNGLPQKVKVNLNHREGTVKYGDYSSCKNAHVNADAMCMMTVSVDETVNYTGKVANFYLHIEPYKLMVEPDVFRIMYGIKLGRDNLNKNYIGVNGENVVVYFYKAGTGDNLSVGEYDIGGATVYNTINYTVEMIRGSGEKKIKIVPAPVEIRFFNYENLVYDGNIKNVGIRVFGTNDDVGLNVDYNGKSIIKNAGDYRINVSLTNQNYYISNADYIEFSIAKANYDVSNLKLNNKKVAFNFKSHFINLEGEMPEGLVAVYAIDNNKGNGTFAPFKHTVTVTFEGDYINYNYVESMTAVLNVSMTWVWVVLILFVVVVCGGFGIVVFLAKTGKIRLRNRLKRSKIRKIIKRNKELNAINEMIARKKEELSKQEEEEQLVIEEPVKFVKNPVKVTPEELIQLSFVDKLYRSEFKTKNYYSEVKNELLSYEGVVSKIKRDYETFYLNNMPVAKFDVINGSLVVYFALDPAMYNSDEYNHENVSKQKDFVSVPLKLKVHTIESLRHAKMFVRIIRKKEKIKFVSNFIRTDYVKIYTAKDNSLKLFKKVFSKKNKKED